MTELETQYVLDIASRHPFLTKDILRVADTIEEKTGTNDLMLIHLTENAVIHARENAVDLEVATEFIIKEFENNKK